MGFGPPVYKIPDMMDAIPTPMSGHPPRYAIYAMMGTTAKVIINARTSSLSGDESRLGRTCGADSIVCVCSIHKVEIVIGEVGAYLDKYGPHHGKKSRQKGKFPP